MLLNKNYDISCRMQDSTTTDVKFSGSSKDIAKPQMDNSVVTDFESHVTIDKESTTEFVEGSTVINGATSNTTAHVSTYVENAIDIKSFLARPYCATTGAWTTLQAQNTNLYQSDIASTLTTVAMWADKIKGFNLIRGDFMIKVVLNASPFQQGRLILHYLPNLKNFVAVNSKYEKFKNTTIVQKIQHPHVELDARDTSITMRIPYTSPTQWYSIQEQYYDWGRFYLDVLSPLKTGAAAPVSQEYVDYSIFAWWENIELNANTVPQSSKVVRKSGAVEEKELQGPIESGLRRVGKVATIAEGIPLVSEYAKAVSWASHIGANLASVFGWSKPRELEGQTNVYTQTLRYAGTCDGPSAAIPGGMSVLNRLETIDYGSYTNEDEMSLAFLYSIPYYAGSFTWGSSDGSGTSLYSHKISPVSILTTGTQTVGGHIVTYEEHVPFTYFARFHNYWRGGLKITLKFIKTQMHSGRLQVTWTPLNVITTTPDLGTSAFSKRAIVDIRTEDSVTFELPYLLYSDYAPLGSDLYENTTSGQIDIQILNDLRGPESVSQDIDVLVFYSPADDFELAAPSPCHVCPVPYVPQSSSAVLVRDSEKQGMSMASMEIGGKNTSKDLLFHAKRCIGEKMMSIKSYLLRNCVIQGPSTSTLAINTLSYLLIDPWFMSAQVLDGTGVQKAPQFAGDHLSLIGLCYAYCRGSINMTLYDTNNTKKVVSVVVPNEEHSFDFQPWSTSGAQNNAIFGNSVGLSGAQGYMPFEPGNISDANGVAYQHIPYYNKFPYSLCTYYNSVDDIKVDYSRSITQAQFYCNGNYSSATTIQRSVGDDFQLMFFTGCPLLVRTYA